MYEFIKNASAARLAWEVMPLAIALFIAEIFFKFGTFTLEAVGFLATWFVLSALFSKLFFKRDG